MKYQKPVIVDLSGSARTKGYSYPCLSGSVAGREIGCEQGASVEVVECWKCNSGVWVD